MITKIQSESLNLADDFAFTGTITGAGENNNPYFYVVRTSNQSVTSAVFTKAQYDSVRLDTTSDWDASNYRYTPSVAGKYLFFGNVWTQDGYGEANYHETSLYKNGSRIVGNIQDGRNAGGVGYGGSSTVVTVQTMNGTTDYVEMYGAIDSDYVDTLLVIQGNASVDFTYFGGFLISKT